MERVADYIVRKVNEAGADYIFLVTGRGILYLTDAVARNQSIKSVSTFHEQGASYAAMAYASVCNNVSACLISTGCAATNAVTAALCAYQDNLPVIFISGNNPLKENTRHTGSAIRTYGSQEADIIRIVSSVTKYAVMLEDSDQITYEVEKALYLAMEGRRGPVWIDVPLDVQNMRIEERNSKHFIPEKLIQKEISIDICRIVNNLKRADRPVLLIGGGAYCAKKEIKRIAEDLNLPVVFSPAAVDIYGSAHKCSIGAVGSVGGSRAGNFVIQNCDYLLAVGTKLCSQLTGARDKFVREGNITVVDIDPVEHSKDGIKIDDLLILDAQACLHALIAEKLELDFKNWMEQCIHWKHVFAVSNEGFLEEIKENNQIDLYSLMEELKELLPEDVTVITDAGLEELIIPSAFPFRDGQRCLFPAAQGAMGYAIPAIIGAYAAGRRNIICIVGDGSIMMNIQELQVITALQIPVKIMVVNNNMYAIIRKRQKDLFRNRTIGNDPTDGVPQPDFMALAAGFGLGYKRVKNREELLKILPELMTGENSRPELIEIIAVPDQKYLHESYALNEKRRLVHRPIEDMSPFLPREVLKKEMVIGMLEE